MIKSILARTAFFNQKKYEIYYKTDRNLEYTRSDGIYRQGIILEFANYNVYDAKEGVGKFVAQKHMKEYNAAIPFKKDII